MKSARTPGACGAWAPTRIVRGFLALSFAGLASTACSGLGGAPDAAGAPMLLSVLPIDSLLSATVDPVAASGLDPGRLAEISTEVPQDNPLWPAYTYLVAEIRRLRGEPDSARASHRRLAEWALSNPVNDGWGGSGLAALSLWRLLSEAEARPPEARPEVEALLRLVDGLGDARLVRGMFETPILSSLPQVQEEIARLAALVAFRAGLEEEARVRFVTFLGMARSATLGPDEARLRDAVISSGLARSDLLALAVGRRLRLLGGREDQAEGQLREARRSADSQVRAEAALHLAQLPTLSRRASLALLDSAVAESSDPAVTEEALYQRGLRNAALASGDTILFRADMAALLEEFPDGARGAAALWQLARHYEDRGDLDEALRYFERLESFEGPNDYADRALYGPALALYTAGRTREAAARLERLRARGEGELYPHTLFWLGRIAEEGGDLQKAARYFGEVIAASPWDYYGVRARMHAHMGTSAREAFWPDSETRADIRRAYEAGTVERSAGAASPYHVRVTAAIESGLYTAALGAETEIPLRLGARRPQDAPLADVDASGELPALAVLLAVRQDARAAKDWVPDAANRLAVSTAVGYGAGDWPLAELLAMARTEPYEMLAAAQRDERFLAAAFPKVDLDLFATAARAHSVEPELLYGVARIESAFFSAALSRDRALGLFQFTESTFRQLDERWGLRKETGIDSWMEYLIAGERSADLAARWFEVLPNPRLRRTPDGGANTLLKLFEHQKGYANLTESDARWKSLGRERDVEYMIETFGFAEARIFGREVMPGMVVARAAGLFEGG